MKQNPNFLLREVAGSIVIVPVGPAAIDFPGMMTLNDTGKFLWEQLAQEQTEATLVAALLEHYDVQEELAQKDVQAFLQNLRTAGALVEEQA